MIMIIVQRGRMGDTFPTSCIQFDLRARYLNPGKDFTSVIQDVGRAFGYGERPTLVLSKKASDFLKTVWDFNSDSLAWSKLKEDKIKVMLGSQMKKKKLEDQSSPSKRPRVDDGADDGDDDDDDDDLEVDENDDDNEIKILQSIYQTDCRNPVFLYHLGPDSFKHRLILKAEPQIGKTGAFLNLIYKLSQSLRQSDSQYDRTWLQNFTREVYCEKSLEVIEKEFKTAEGRKDHSKYMSMIGGAREGRKRDGVFEPSKWASQVLVGKVLGSKKRRVTIADFGCGDMAFAKHLAEEIINGHDTIKKTEFIYHGYDISPNPIKDITNPPNLTIVKHPGVNCSKVANFGANEFDFVISTCALWGKEPTWKDTLKTGFHALEQDGFLLVAESSKRLNSEVESMLDVAGIRCAMAQWSAPRDIKQTFYANFHARECSITEDYSPNHF